MSVPALAVVELALSSQYSQLKPMLSLPVNLRVTALSYYVPVVGLLIVTAGAALSFAVR